MAHDCVVVHGPAGANYGATPTLPVTDTFGQAPETRCRSACVRALVSCSPPSSWSAWDAPHAKARQMPGPCRWPPSILSSPSPPPTCSRSRSRFHQMAVSTTMWTRPNQGTQGWCCGRTVGRICSAWINSWTGVSCQPTVKRPSSSASRRPSGIRCISRSALQLPQRRPKRPRRSMCDPSAVAEVRLPPSPRSPAGGLRPAAERTWRHPFPRRSPARFLTVANSRSCEECTPNLFAMVIRCS